MTQPWAGTKGIPRAQREQQILDVAAREFGRAGYAHASLVDIAALAGISKPLIYTYFGSKEGLYLACLHRAGDSLVESVAAAQVGDPRSRALATIRAIFEALDGRQHEWPLLWDATLPADSNVLEGARQYRRALNELGATGTGAVLASVGNADPDDHALLADIWINVVSTVVKWWLDHASQSPDVMTDRCLRLIGAFAGADLGSAASTSTRVSMTEPSAIRRGSA